VVVVIEVEGNLILTGTNKKKTKMKKTIATLGDGVEVRQSTLGPCAGMGLFATRPFLMRSRITEYDGELLDYSEMQQRLKNDLHSHIRSLDFRSLGIDGKNLKAGSIYRGGGSFANDARCNVVNNASFQKVTGAGVQRDGEFESLNRIVLIATRDIQMNEEIFVHYGKTYWKRQDEFLARCNSVAT
jgi:SET domain-containing protein